jgi:arylsulfatase A-like enzyme
MKMQTRREFLKAFGGAVVFSTSIRVLGTTEQVARGDKTTRPNILLFFPDQHRFDWLGTNPKLPVRTPNLDRLAKHGVLFSRAFCPSPLCAPARACLASGKEYDRCGVENNGFDYPLAQRTFYTLLRDSGYHVAGVGKFDLHKSTLNWGLDGSRLVREWGFSEGIDNAGKWDAIRSGAEVPKDPYMAYLHRRGLAAIHVNDFAKRRNYAATFPTPLPEEAYCDNWVGNNGLQFLRTFPKDRPWFLIANFTGPHGPMDVTERMYKRWQGVDFPQPHQCEKFDPATHVQIRRNYSAMVENIDRWLGIYVEEMKRRGDLSNTIIAYSSDHGEMLGDHNRWGKGVAYQPSVGVPLIVWGPGVVNGLVSDALVSVMDLTATFLDYASVPRPQDMDSISLRPLLEGKTKSHRPHVFSGLNKWRMVFDGKYKLILTEGKSPVLYDLVNDPFEDRNIADQSPKHVERLGKLIRERAGFPMEERGLEPHPITSRSPATSVSCPASASAREGLSLSPGPPQTSLS